MEAALLFVMDTMGESLWLPACPPWMSKISRAPECLDLLDSPKLSSPLSKQIAGPQRKLTSPNVAPQRKLTSPNVAVSAELPAVENAGVSYRNT